MKTRKIVLNILLGMVIGRWFGLEMKIYDERKQHNILFYEMKSVIYGYQELWHGARTYVYKYQGLTQTMLNKYDSIKREKVLIKWKQN